VGAAKPNAGRRGAKGKGKCGQGGKDKDVGQGKGCGGSGGQGDAGGSGGGAEAVAAAVEAAAASNLRGMANMVPVTHHGCRVKSRVARGAASEGATEAMFMNLIK